MAVSKPAWRIQTLFDLARHEGFRPWPYPDALSRIGRRFAGAKYRWGFKPPRLIMAELGITNEREGAPWTNGFGETKGVTPDTPEVRREQQMIKLEDRLLEHVKGLDVLLPRWREYPVVVQTVLANMIYNLGYDRLSKFQQTLALIAQGRYADAADNLTHTAWHKQVGERALELEERLRTGKIADKHLVVAIKNSYDVKPDFSEVEGRVIGPQGVIKKE